MQDDHRYLELAWRQHGLITHRQMLDLGFSASGITRRRRAQLLSDVARGLYAVPGAPLDTVEGRAAAAILQTRHLAAASHVTAARLHGLRGWARETSVHITAVRAANPRLPSGTLHRSEVLEPIDVVRAHAPIPLVRPERAVIGVAELQPGRARAVIDEAILAGLTTPDRLWRYLTRFGGRGAPGSGAVKEVLEGKAPRERPTESDLERQWIRVLAAHGLWGWVPQLEVRTPDGVFRIDLAHPVLPVGLEFDSRIWHSSEEDYRRERRKRYALAKAGYRILPVTELDLHERAATVATDALDAVEVMERARAGRRRTGRFWAPLLPDASAS